MARGLTDEERAKRQGFPSVKVHLEWLAAHTKARHCRKAGDIAGEEAAKRIYRAISREHTGEVKPNQAKWQKKIGYYSPSDKLRRG